MTDKITLWRLRGEIPEKYVIYKIKRGFMHTTWQEEGYNQALDDVATKLEKVEIGREELIVALSEAYCTDKHKYQSCRPLVNTRYGPSRSWTTKRREMRPIKFRVWNENKMIDVKVLEYVPAHQSFNGNPGYNVNYHLGVPAKNVMQFTGLLDKHGKEIYEGDILDHYATSGAVIFEEGMFCLNMQAKVNFGHRQPLCFIDVSQSEIIGNLYETPELLKGE